MASGGLPHPARGRSVAFEVVVHLPNGRTAEHMLLALSRQLAQLPTDRRRTLTRDQWKDIAEHVRFTIDTDIDISFCDPHIPWQRSSSEHTNRLLPQYFPNGADLSTSTRPDLVAVARELNVRPRHTLEWMKPSEVFTRAVASST